MSPPPRHGAELPQLRIRSPLFQRRHNPEKSLKALQDEIRSVIRQVTARVTFLPLLEVSCQFDLLIYADKDLVVPEKWEESGLRFITKSEQVRLCSFSYNPQNRVCQQQGLSLWVPFQNAATAVTNLYKESVDTHQRSFDIGIQIGYQRRNKDVLAWVKKRRRTIRREDLINFLCGKVPPPRNSRAPPRLTVVSPNRATSTETSSSVETDLQPFREAIALHGLSGAMASISVRSSTPGSPTHVSSGSNASRRRNGLHDVDLNTFISEEMALHLDNGGTRKRTSAQCGDVITDSPTHKRNRMI
ncbi:hypothetical protein D623_10019188 [Myotis brandtii]|uniref:HORMA domain-containing protein n=1 Tax=Myotis brandtii TaxID=109478 RepID=S7N4Z0_MYOBR|nr:hypothetical protein D623_10019188 [Myotis brandtii]